MSEILRQPAFDVEITGNSDIQTQLGLLNLEVNVPSLQNELLSVVDEYQPNNPEAKQMARIRANHLIIDFGGVPLNQALAPWFERILTNQNVESGKKVQTLAELNSTFAGYDSITASSFINPLDTAEYVFYFNLPLMIEARGLKTQAEFIENFRFAWIHERHHFAQAADTDAFADRMQREQNILGLLLFGYGVGVPIVTGIGGSAAASKAIGAIEKVSHKPVSRRDFFKLAAGGTMALVGLIGAAGTSSFIKYNLQYNNPLSFEGEANKVAETTPYSLLELSKTFQISTH